MVAPAKWKNNEDVRDNRERERESDKICELVATWDYIKLLDYGGLHLDSRRVGPKPTTNTFCPYIIRSMADESLRQIAQALERLV